MSEAGRTLPEATERNLMFYVTAQNADRLWKQYGSWSVAPDYDLAHNLQDLAPLPRWPLYPEGGRRPLWLPGWDDRSVWGFDPPLNAYFAQLWRNPDADQRDDPDIWILGRGTFEGRPYAVETAGVLAHEIAVATGAELAAVVRAMLD